MENIERLIWKKIDETISQSDQEILNQHPDQNFIKEEIVRLSSLDSSLKTNALLKSPKGFVSRVMYEIQHLSIIPKVNYNRILSIAIGSLTILTLALYLMRNRFDQTIGGKFDGVFLHLDFAAYDIGHLSITPYLAIIPCLTILVWIDQTFSRQH